MRLSKEQMRIIRDHRMKRADWAGKNITIWDEHIGVVCFGKAKIKNPRMLMRRRVSHRHPSDFCLSARQFRYD